MSEGATRGAPSLPASHVTSSRRERSATETPRAPPSRSTPRRPQPPPTPSRRGGSARSSVNHACPSSRQTLDGLRGVVFEVAQRRKDAKRSAEPRASLPLRPPRASHVYSSGLCALAPLRETNDAAHPTPPLDEPAAARHSAPPPPSPPTFFATPSCVRSPHTPNFRCAAPRTRRPQAPVALSTPKTRGRPSVTSTGAPERFTMDQHRAQSPGLSAGPRSHNRPAPLAEPPPEPPRPGPTA